MIHPNAAINDFLTADIADIAKNPSLPTMLEVICRSTGLGFAAVARVTDEKWIACSIRDELGLGIAAGDEVEAQKTLCDQARRNGKSIVIDEISKDGTYSTHFISSQHGLQSFISMPIILPDGTFFGTLCAVDRKPAKLNNPNTLRMFELFAELIAYDFYRVRSEQGASFQNQTSERRTGNG